MDDLDRALDKQIGDGIEEALNLRRSVGDDREDMVLGGWVAVCVWIDGDGDFAYDRFSPLGQLPPTTRGLLEIAVEEFDGEEPD